MIRPLRSRHRILTTIMLVVSAGGLGVGLAARRPMPTMTTLPAALSPEAAPITTPLPLSWTGEGAPVAALDARGRLSLTLGEPLRRPDPLLYWAPAAGMGQPGEGLPDGAIFLGAVTGDPAQRLALPDAVGPGRLLIFSLGHAQVVAAADFARGAP